MINIQLGEAKAFCNASCERAAFESAELLVMHHQQAAANALGSFYNSNAPEDAKSCVNQLKKAVAAQEVAVEKARQANIPDGYLVLQKHKWLAARRIQNENRKILETLKEFHKISMGK